MKKIFGIAIAMAIFLVGCNGAKSIEDAFYIQIKSNNAIDDYSILYQKKLSDKSGIVLYTTYKENASTYENESVGLAYIARNDKNKWEWVSGSSCGSKWSGVTTEKPYIWCGTIVEPKYSKVFVEETEVEIVKVEGNKRVWFYVGDNENPKIKAVLQDGSVEWFKEM